MYSPLEQFEVIPFLNFSMKFSFFSSPLVLDFSPTNSSVILILAALLPIIFKPQPLEKIQAVGSRWDQGWFNYLGGVLGIRRENLGAGPEYSPLIVGLFTYLAILNLGGFLPYVFTPTTQLAVGLGLSFMIWLGALILGLSNHGLNFTSAFMPAGTPLVLCFLLVPIEILSYSARAFSLGLRLTINVATGHLLQHIIGGFSYNFFIWGLEAPTAGAAAPLFFASLFPTALLVALSFLEAGILLMQAFVFTTLTAIYIGDSIELH